MTVSHTPPSIKGSALGGVIEDVTRLRDAGRIDDARLRAVLDDDERGLLDVPIAAARWYPIRAYARLTELLLDVEGGGRVAYLAERGAKTASRLAESGLYHQLARTGGDVDVDPRTLPPDEQKREFGRTCRLVVTLSGSIFNFGDWRVGPDPDHAERFRITVDDAAALPDVALHTIEGFMNGISELSPTIAHLRWHGARIAPDTVVYTMDADVGEVYGAGPSD